MKRINRTNDIIKWGIIIIDFLLLNILIFFLFIYNPLMENWEGEQRRIFMIMTNIALGISEYYNSPLVHLRLVSIADILKRLPRLGGVMAVGAYILMKGTNQNLNRTY